MKLSISKVIIVVAALGAAIGSGWNGMKEVGGDFLPIRYVRVGGVFQYLEKEELRKQLLPVVSTNFFTADMQEIRKVTEIMPWVRKAEIRRIWPDTLDIRLNEQQAVFRWGKDGLLNNNGELFKPKNTDLFVNLPLIKGPEGKEKKLFAVLNQMNEELIEYGLGLKELHVSNRRSWKLKLSNGIEMQLGRKEPMMRFQRFLKVIPVLEAEKIEMIEKMDMRYPNGFTVTWKEGYEPEWNQPDKLSKRKG